MQQKFTRQQHQLRIAAPMERGVSTQSAEFLLVDPNVETPMPILRELDRRMAQKGVLKEKRLGHCGEEKADI